MPCKNQPFCKIFSLLESSVVMSPCYKHAQVKAVQFKNGGRKSLRWEKLFYCIKFALWTFDVWEIRFSVEIGEPSRGYNLEVFDAHFVLPHRGPIGIIKWKSHSLSLRKEILWRKSHAWTSAAHFGPTDDQSKTLCVCKIASGSKIMESAMSILEDT